MTVIRTPRLTLRPFNEGDIDAMVALLNDWEVAQWLAIPPFPYRRADARFYVDHVRANHEAGAATEFAIALTEGDGVVGSIGLRRIRQSRCMRQSGTGWVSRIGGMVTLRKRLGRWWLMASAVWGWSGLRPRPIRKTNDRRGCWRKWVSVRSAKPPPRKRGPVACRPGAALSW